MTIDEDIEVLSDPSPDIDGIMSVDYADAIKLGIEARKQRLQDLEGNPLLDGELLPGETK